MLGFFVGFSDEGHREKWLSVIFPGNHQSYVNDKIWFVGLTAMNRVFGSAYQTVWKLVLSPS